LSVPERAELDRLLTAKVEDNPLWKAFRGTPQQLAFYSAADELYYGGAAGGGKTDLEMGLALTRHQRSIILRREYPQLLAIIDRLRKLVGTEGKYNGQDHVFKMNSGRSIELGAVQREWDKQKYQGRPHDLVCFDELPQFSESQYRFLNGWKRTEVVGQRVRTVGAGNPPLRKEERWVITYWGPWLNVKHPNPAVPGELRWFAVIDEDDRSRDVEVDGPEPFEHKGELIAPKSRTFIPASVEDNPHYMATGYKSQLQALPEPLRSKLLRGDFSESEEEDPYQVIPTEWVKLAQEQWKPDGRNDGGLSALGVDVARGGKDYTVFAPRYGQWFAELMEYPGKDTPNGQSVVMLFAPILGKNGTAFVDVIGVGGSVCDVANMQGVRAVPVNFASRSERKDKTGQLRFVNLRAEYYWRLREALDPVTGDNLALPPSSKLLADLCEPRWELRAGGILIESKDQIIERLGRSPDSGDALVIAYNNNGEIPALSNISSMTRRSPARAEEW
jgi:hypothetical protein